VSFQSRTVGVTQPAKTLDASDNVARRLSTRFKSDSRELFKLFASAHLGVGHPERSVSDVRRTDARRRERDTPEGVTHAFHVSVYKVDPSIDSLACNLLSKDDCRPTLRDEVLPGRP
jgi:hypothetical protein